MMKALRLGHTSGAYMDGAGLASAGLLPLPTPKYGTGQS